MDTREKINYEFKEQMNQAKKFFFNNKKNKLFNCFHNKKKEKSKKWKS